MNAAEQGAGLTERGFTLVGHAPRDPIIRTGARVRNASEQFPRAVDEGAATILAVYRRGTDERPDSWESDWGRPNVEVVVERDGGLVTTWPDYRTVVVDRVPVTQ